MSEELVIFPDHFLPIPGLNPKSQNKYPRIIGGLSKEEVVRTAIQRMEEVFRIRKKGEYPSPQGECSFKPLQVDFQERIFYLIFQNGDFLVFDPPLESRSKRAGSVALYHAAHKEMGLLLHSILANGMTSPHYHKIWTEITFLLTGKAELKTCENRHLLTHQLTEASPVGPVVRPGTTHQIFTSQPSLILIKITGDENWFDKWLTGQEHHFQEFPSSQGLFTK